MTTFLSITPRSLGSRPSRVFSFGSSFTILILLGTSIASPLLDTIKSIPELSKLDGLISNNPNLVNLFSTTNAFTLLAPSNDALDTWLNSTLPPDVVEATIRYHLLKKSFTTEQFGANPLFEHTYLENKSYTNVSNGQFVELFERNGTKVVSSGNRSESTIIAKNRIANGGFIQTVDRVLSIPLSLVPSISEFDMPFFATVLNAGGYIDQGTVPVISRVIRTPDLTFFAPNTKEALDEMTAQAATQNRTQMSALFAYHVVPGVTFANSLRNGTKLQTLQGQNLSVIVSGSDIYVNGAKILTSDYLIANGVLHTVDNLLNPNNITVPSVPLHAPASQESGSGGLSTIAKAGIAVGIIALVILIVGLFIFLNDKRKTRHEKQLEAHNDTTVKGHNMTGLSDRSVASEIGGQQVISNHIGHHMQPGPMPEYPLPVRSTSDIELDSRRRSGRILVQNVNKQWEYKKDPVELDGSGIKYY